MRGGKGTLFVAINHPKRMGEGFPAVPCPCADTFAVSNSGREHELDVAGGPFVEGCISGQGISRTEETGF